MNKDADDWKKELEHFTEDFADRRIKYYKIITIAIASILIVTAVIVYVVVSLINKQ